jgi:hypothetical protein
MTLSVFDIVVLAALAVIFLPRIGDRSAGKLTYQPALRLVIVCLVVYQLWPWLGPFLGPLVSALVGAAAHMAYGH